MYIKNTEGKPENVPFISSLLRLWKIKCFCQNQSKILSFEERLYKIIYTENYLCFIHQLTTDLSGVWGGKFDYFFTSECLYLEILHQWSGGDMERKASLSVILYTWMSIFGDFCISGGVGIWRGRQVWL